MSEPMLPTIRLAGRNSDADVERDRHVAQSEQRGQLDAKRRNARQHVERRQPGQAGLIGLGGEGRTPIGHDGVADILIDDAAVLVDRC